MIQATAKGFIQRARFMKHKMTRKDRAALKIQKVVRGFFARKMYKRQRNAIMSVQANVLAR